MAVNINNSINKLNQDVNFGELINKSAKDGRIDNSEAGQIKSFIQNSSLPDIEKNKFSNFIDKLSTSTTETKNFLFSSKEVTKNLSNADMDILNQLSAKNKIAERILDLVVATQTELMDTSSVNKSLKGPGGTANSSLSFVDSTASPAQANNSLGKPVNGMTKNSHMDDFSKWYKTQFTANDFSLIEQNRFKEVKNADCGPTSASMILGAFNFPTPSNDQIRKDIGVKHKHAISEGELKNIVTKYSGGQIKQFSQTNYNSKNADKMIDDLRNEVAKGRMPVLLTSAMSADYGHYTVVIGVKDNGNVLVADPSNPSGPREYTKDDLVAAMQRRDGKHMPNTIASYGKS